MYARNAIAAIAALKIKLTVIGREGLVDIVFLEILLIFNEVLSIVFSFIRLDRGCWISSV